MKSDDMPFTCAMLDYFVEIGGTCIDTAYVYGGGRAERALGQWIQLRGNREQVVILGKGAHTPYCTVDGINTQLLENLDRLQTEYIDLWLMHRDNPEIAGMIFAEHSEHGYLAAPIARHVMETYFAKKEGRPLPEFPRPSQPAMVVASASPAGARPSAAEGRR
jgi:aryl-alcohol dehydrogenase-like predicted oxidoreductase